MDFSTPEHLRPLLARCRDVTDGLEPLERRLVQGFAAIEGELGELRERLRGDGLWLPQLAPTWGGMGLSVLEHGLVSEVLGRSPLGHYALGCQAPDAGNMEILAEFGTPSQQELFLRPLTEGSARSAFGMTEPDRAGSNPVWLATRAVADGGDFVIDGRKWFTSGADGAAFVIVMAVTDPDAEPHRRASMFIVPTDTPGYALVRNIPIMGDAGSRWASHGEIRLDGVRVPAAYRLGGSGEGFGIAQARLGPGRIHHCMRWIGICERSFDMMARRAVTRELAPGERLADQQAIQTFVAQSRAEINAARLMVLEAAWKIDRVGAKAAREEISLIKFFVADVMSRVVDRAIQVHGAAGMTDDLVLSYFFRHERAARIYDGPDEVHRSVVARRIFRRYAAEDGKTHG